MSAFLVICIEKYTYLHYSTNDISVSDMRQQK